MRWRRRASDRVTPALWQEVVQRDLRYAGGCVAAFLDPTHVCTDKWGQEAPSSAADSLEHVKDELRMGKRAPSDAEHLVLICAGLNIRVPSKAQRGLFREYLRRVNAQECPHVDPVFGCSSCARRTDPLTVGQS